MLSWLSDSERAVDTGCVCCLQQGGNRFPRAGFSNLPFLSAVLGSLLKSTLFSESVQRKGGEGRKIAKSNSRHSLGISLAPGTVPSSPPSLWVAEVCFCTEAGVWWYVVPHGLETGPLCHLHSSSTRVPGAPARLRTAGCLETKSLPHSSSRGKY